MLKYLTVAALLKLFSSNSLTKRVYRYLGNTIGSKRRTRKGLPENYINRGRSLLELIRKHNIIQSGDSLLELGTGWVHWESVFLRLFYDVSITGFDVWDNRQLAPFKLYFSQLKGVIDTALDLTPSVRERVHSLLDSIASVNSYDELYHLLGFKYMVEPGGTLHRLQDGSFNVIYSCNVMEHINAEILPEYVRDFNRLLKPGGYSVHTIDLGDHISDYTKSVSSKNYLKYSDKTWKRYFENDVQYFNRVQRPDWLNLFEKAGLELIWEEPKITTINFSVNEKYSDLSLEDLGCTDIKVIHRKTL